mmetsp:Transcript_3603/g.5222  ORF Transcript_3603/g.5222 Transcript_3603/m.5222 type:complete len:286 (-) Transcript_3603:531-1388(-)
MPSCDFVPSDAGNDQIVRGLICADWDVAATFFTIFVVGIPMSLVLMYAFFRQWRKYRNAVWWTQYAILIGFAAVCTMFATFIVILLSFGGVRSSVALSMLAAFATSLTNAYVSSRIALCVNVLVDSETMGQEKRLWKRFGFAYVAFFISVIDFVLAVSVSAFVSVNTQIDPGFGLTLVGFVSCILNALFLLGGCIYAKLALNRGTGIQRRLFVETGWMAGWMFFAWGICRPVLLMETLPGQYLATVVPYIGAWMPFVYKRLRDMCFSESSQRVLLETTKVEQSEV